MCTVTFIARKHGYALGMNRDEKLARAKGRSPKASLRNGVKVLYPSESSGGTWVAVNEFGATLSLINWYSVANKVEHGSVSRGEIIKALGACDSPDPVDAGLAKLPLPKINPFRLIGVFPAIGKIVEWRWDLKKLVRKKYPWATRQWVSSGFDEPKAQLIRGRTFRRALRQSSASSINWLRRLHQSHAPGVGPFSTCMHRADAATVSYTEITVSLSQAKMLYHPGAPCHPKRSPAWWRSSRAMARVT